MVSCSIITSILGCVVTSYLFFRYTWCADFSLLQKSVVFLLFMLMGCAPLFAGYGFEKFLGPVYPFYRYTLYFIYIGCIILFTVTLISDAVFFILAYTPLIHKLKFFCCWANYINLGLAILFTAYALYAGLKVPDVKIVTVSSPKIKNEQRIAVLSDLHIHRVISDEKIKKIVEQTNAQNPDVILLAGDVVDDAPDKTAAPLNLLKELKAKEGIFFVTGNHEFYTGYGESVKALLASGFVFLENDGVAINEQLYIGGIPDLTSPTISGPLPNVEEAMAAAKSGQFKILVSHTPADFEEKNVFDLEVSGHTHGGQIFPFHILVKLQNKFLAGLYDLSDNAKIYVTRGAGQWGPQMRFLAPSEITIIKLVPQS